MMNEEEKDALTCDMVFALYLRDVCKRVNENYYKTCLRFVLLYRECLNEHGWLKRREHYAKAGILDQDEVLNRLKAQEEQEERAMRLFNGEDVDPEPSPKKNKKKLKKRRNQDKDNSLQVVEDTDH